MKCPEIGAISFSLFSRGCAEALPDGGALFPCFWFREFDLQDGGIPPFLQGSDTGDVLWLTKFPVNSHRAGKGGERAVRP